MQRLLELEKVDICAANDSLSPLFPLGRLLATHKQKEDLGLIAGYLCATPDTAKTLKTIDRFSPSVGADLLQKEGKGESFHVPVVDDQSWIVDRLNVTQLTPQAGIEDALHELASKIEDPAQPPVFSSCWSRFAQKEHSKEYLACINKFLHAPKMPYRRKASDNGIDIWFNRHIVFGEGSDEAYIDAFIDLYFPEGAPALREELIEKNKHIQQNYPLKKQPRLQLIKIIASSGGQALGLHRDERSEFAGILSLMDRGPDVFVGNPAECGLDIMFIPEKSWSFLLGARAAEDLPALNRPQERRFPYHRSALTENPRLSLALFYAGQPYSSPSACEPL